ncbi:MAG TPA: hypothetical protein VIM07_16690 [Chitinophagaceae bacterium]
MKKLLAIIILISLISSKTFSQEKEIQPLHQRDSAIPMKGEHVKKIKELNLSKQQKKEVKKYRRSNKAKVAAIKNNAALTEQQKKDQLVQLHNEKHEKLETILTPEQKEKLKKMKKDQPRRGVTNMPNERTAK